MANLYDTGAPQKVIVVDGRGQRTEIERILHERVVVVQANVCRECGKATRTTPCEWCHPVEEPMREATRAPRPAIDAVAESVEGVKRLGKRAVRALLGPAK